MITIRKSLQLSYKYLQYNGDKANKIVEDLNHLLNDKVHFSIDENGKLNILVYEEKLKSKAGRPVGHDFDYSKVEQMKADGKTNKEIYTELGMSKALYYLRMKEYKNNIGQ